MTGKVAPVIENPVPISVNETLIAVLPEGVRVSVLVEVVCRLTLPKER